MTITIQGANDAPVAVTETVFAVEAGGRTMELQVRTQAATFCPMIPMSMAGANGETKTVSGVVAGSALSRLRLRRKQRYRYVWSDQYRRQWTFTYVVDNNNATVQALRISGQTINDVSSPIR